MSEGRVCCCLKEASDHASQCSNLHIKEPQTSILGLPVKDKFTWLLKTVMVEPGLNIAVDGGDVLLPQVQGAALKPNLGESKGICRVGPRVSGINLPAFQGPIVLAILD